MKKGLVLINRINPDLMQHMINRGFNTSLSAYREMKENDNIELLSFGAVRQIAFFGDILIEDVEDYF